MAPEILPLIRAKVRPQDFYRDSNGNVYRAMCAIADADGYIDELTLLDKLESHGAKRDSTESYIHTLVKAATSTPNFLHHDTYADIVADLAFRRRLLYYSTEVAGWAADEREDSAVITSKVADALRQVLEQQRSDVAHISELTSDFADFVAERMANPDSLVGLPTSLRGLDDLTGGLPNALVVPAGVTSSGKTALVLQIARHNAQTGHGVLFYSLEMAQQSLLQRMAAAETGINSELIRRGRTSEDQAGRLFMCMEQFNKLPFYFSHNASPTATDIHAQIARHKMTHKLSLVVVDYIQLVRSFGRQRADELETLASALQNIAVTEQVCILAPSQFNRAYSRRDSGRPQLSDLRSSGGIENAADMVVIVHRPEMWLRERGDLVPDALEGRVELIIAKNRNGAGRIGLNEFSFDETTGIFSDDPH